MRLVIPYETSRVDIYSYPRDPENPGDHLPNEGSITIPDLHGNTLKLVHFLMAHDVIQFNSSVTDPKAAYEQFSGLYDEAGTLASNYNELKFKLKSAQNNLTLQENRTDGNRSYLREAIDSVAKVQEEIAQYKINLRTRFTKILAQFNEFLSQLKVTNAETLVRLIGDDLADRGSNDYFTLKLLDFLHHNDVKVTTLISNHGIEFIRSWVKPNEHAGLSPDDRLSYIGLEALIDLHLVTKQEVTALIELTYKPTLKLLDYSLTGDGIVLFSHAPIRFDSIKGAANRLGVSYEDSTPIELAETIENINAAFQFELTDKPIETIYEEYFSFLDTERGTEIMSGKEGLTTPDDASMRPGEIAQWPLVHFTWNRWDEEKDQDDTARPAQHKDYRIQYVHGHDTYQNPAHTHVSNLDTFLGKYPAGKRERAQERSLDITQYKMMVAPYTPITPTITRETWAGPRVIVQEPRVGEPAEQVRMVRRPAPSSTKIPIKRVLAAIGLGILVGLGFGIGVGLLATGVAAPFGAGIIGLSFFAATTSAAGALFAGLGVFLGLHSNKKQQLPPARHEIQDSQAERTRSTEPRTSASALSGLGPALNDNAAAALKAEKDINPLEENRTGQATTTPRSETDEFAGQSATDELAEANSSGMKDKQPTMETEQPTMETEQPTQVDSPSNAAL